MSEPLAVAHVSPYAWEADHDVNRLVARVCDELQGRGHRALVLAPSRDSGFVRESRALIRSARDAPDRLFDDGAVRVLAVAEVLPDLPTGRTRSPALPIDVTRTIEELLTFAPLDLVHVHEPFAPSTASAALRHSRALNVGSFHLPAERLVSTQVARKVVQLVFGRMDARVASFGATATLLRRFFPAEYRVIHPGADLPAERAPRPSEDGGPVRVVFVDDQERSALRIFLRALRLVDTDLPWEAVVLSERGPSSSTPLRAELRERVRFVGAAGQDELLASADVVVSASDGAMPAPGTVLRALAAGAVPLASSIEVHEEVIENGGGPPCGLLFAADEPQTLASQLTRLVTDGALRDELVAGAASARERLSWQRVADEHEELYTSLAARRRPVEGNPEVRRRLARRPRIDVDLHMHTDHSGDCATPVEVLLATAKEQGLGAIAVTDHNEVSGAFDAQAKAAEYGVKVIIGEEVKTAEQGEVIGLFLTEKIPRGLTLAETVAEIRRQGGVVYVPHPFDRMHSVPDYEHLQGILDDIDAIEIYNPRVAIGSFNEEAERFAAKYRLLAGAGSDAHVAQGLGSVRVRMADFDGPEEFLESLREAEIVTKPSSLLYVQALKFLETKATPPAARRAVRQRRVRRATRKA